MKLTKTIAILAMAATAASAQNKAYSGAELYSLDEWMYGKYEARMMMGATSGTVSSMFLYHNGSETGAGPWSEIDIEILGKSPGSFQSNIITGTASKQIRSEEHHSVSPKATQAFHTYGLEWTPNYVRWTLDGKVVRETRKDNDNKNQINDLANSNQKQGIRFNLWASESQDWVGPWNENNLPVFQFINWVKKYNYTPGQGPDGSDFTLDWTDNFDTFDSGRWGKGDWTFDGNRVDLTAQNIYTKDGMVILALTKKGQEMFNGQVPQDNETPVTPASSSSVQQPSQQSSSSMNPWEQQQSSSSMNPWEQQQSSSSMNPWEQQQSSSSMNPWEQQSSSSQNDNPWNNPSSSATIANPWEQSSNSQTDAIKDLRPQQLQHKNRGTFNAKGERVNKASASRYRVDFYL